jgi:hypothetical protein
VSIISTLEVPKARRFTTAPSRLRSALLSTLAALLAVVLLPALSAPASAYTVTQSSVPVAPVVYKVEGRHYNSGSAVQGPMWRPWIYQAGPVVYRTTPSGPEYVAVRYTVLRWNGSSWASYYTATSNVTIQSGFTSTRAGALSFLPNAGSGSYSVRIQTTHTDSIGAVRGSFAASMNQSSDNQCNTTRSCAVGNGFVTLGS